MMTNEWLINEFKEEVKTTRHVLKRIPGDRLSWAPHSKSMSLGQLALHVAKIPGELAELFSELTQEVPSVPLSEATSLEEILSTLDESEAIAVEKLSSWGEEDFGVEWKMVQGGNTIMAAPRMVMVRQLMLNHWYHHRGQLTVYLRLLDVALPPVYGSSADEDS